MWSTNDVLIIPIGGNALAGESTSHLVDGFTLGSDPSPVYPVTVACVWFYAFLSDYFHTRWLIVMVQAVSSTMVKAGNIPERN